MNPWAFICLPQYPIQSLFSEITKYIHWAWIILKRWRVHQHLWEITPSKCSQLYGRLLLDYRCVIVSASIIWVLFIKSFVDKESTIVESLSTNDFINNTQILDAENVTMYVVLLKYFLTIWIYTVDIFSQYISEAHNRFW